MKKNVSKVRNSIPKFRESRVFSEELKRKVAKEFGKNLHTISQLAKLYGVSNTTIYRWVYKYTAGMAPGTRKVVQMESEAEKTRQLISQVAELERALGRKQLEIDILKKVLEIGSTELGFDLKKTFCTTRSNGSESPESSIPSQ